jgi:hypothetical protein
MPTLPSAHPVAWDVLQWDRGGMMLRHHWSIVAWASLWGVFYRECSPREPFYTMVLYNVL